MSYPAMLRFPEGTMRSMLGQEQQEALSKSRGRLDAIGGHL